MDSQTLEQHGLTVSNFGFSAVGIGDLGATEYTLVTIAVDMSSSVASFQREMESCLKEIVEACRKSPRADNLMLRLLGFASHASELHGFTPLQDCHPDAYDNCLNIGGMTALVDASVNATEAAMVYGKQLVDNDYDCNGILIIITDGCENNSTNTARQAKEAIDNINKSEALESFVSILVGVNLQGAQAELDQFNQDVGFTQFVDVGDADAKTLAKLAKFVSESISSQSKALGNGAASQPLTF